MKNEDGQKFDEKLNMDTATASEIESTNEKLIDYMNVTGENIAAEQVEYLVKNQKSESDKKQIIDPTFGKLLVVNNKILDVLNNIYRDMYDEQDTSIKHPDKLQKDSLNTHSDTQILDGGTPGNDINFSLPGMLGPRARFGSRTGGKGGKGGKGKPRPVPTGKKKHKKSPNKPKPTSATKPNEKSKPKAPKKTSKTGAGKILRGLRLGKAVPIVGGLIAAGLSVYDSVHGWNNAGESLGISESELTSINKASSAVGSIASGFTFGLVDGEDVSKGVNNLMGGNNDIEKYEDAGIIDHDTIGDSKIDDWNKLKELSSVEIQEIINIDDWDEKIKERLIEVHKSVILREQISQDNNITKNENNIDKTKNTNITKNENIKNENNIDKTKNENIKNENNIDKTKNTNITKNENNIDKTKNTNITKNENNIDKTKNTNITKNENIANINIDKTENVDNSINVNNVNKITNTDMKVKNETNDLSKNITIEDSANTNNIINVQKIQNLQVENLEVKQEDNEIIENIFNNGDVNSIENNNVNEIKIINKNIKKINSRITNKEVELVIATKVGAIEKVSEINETIENLVQKKNTYKERIREIINSKVNVKSSKNTARKVKQITKTSDVYEDEKIKKEDTIVQSNKDVKEMTAQQLNENFVQQTKMQLGISQNNNQNVNVNPISNHNINNYNAKNYDSDNLLNSFEH